MTISPRTLLIIVLGVLLIGMGAAMFYYKARAGAFAAELAETSAALEASQKNAEQLRNALAVYTRDREEIDNASRVTRGVIDRSYSDGQSRAAYLPGAVFDRLRERASAAAAP